MMVHSELIRAQGHPMDMQLTRLIRLTESETPPSRAEIEEHYAECIDDMLAKLERARDTEDPSMYGVAQNALDQVRSELRESVQALTRKRMGEVIAKLRQGDVIGSEDMQLIRIWIVGDADAYLREENNVEDWKNELERLNGEIRRLRSAPVEVDTLEELRALLTDAHGVTRSLEQYLSDRERVRHFEESTRGPLDWSAQNTLADILTRSYQSSTV
jgi:hypothetical protein